MNKIFKFISNLFRKPTNNQQNTDTGVKENSVTKKYERCAMCGCLTDVPVSTPISLRKNYTVGLGQLCNNCAAEQRKSSNN